MLLTIKYIIKANKTEDIFKNLSIIVIIRAWNLMIKILKNAHKKMHKMT